MWKKRKSRRRAATFQVKLIGIFLITLFSLCVVNLLIYRNTNGLMEEVNLIYGGGQTLMELRNRLDAVQLNGTEYLNTNNSKALTVYYENEEECRKLLETLNVEYVQDKELMMEKNIKVMSEHYLECIEKAIRSREKMGTETYQEFYDEGATLLEYLHSGIYSLNNMQYENNAKAYEEFAGYMRLSEFMQVCVFISVGILDIILVIFLTDRLTRPLRQLAETAKEVGKGNLDVSLQETKNGDEIGIVGNAFNQMVLSLREYIRQLRESIEKESAHKEKEILMEAHLKEAQLKYLQAQIDPHFLFNTLNAGAQLAMMENASETYRYIHKVSDFFRYNVKKEAESASLGEEIQLVDDYMYILNIRYSGDICFEKHVDENVGNVLTPSMFLQPIVENCVKHGIKEIDGESKITLSVTKDDDLITVSVRDNGKGMTKEQIDGIFNTVEKDRKRKETKGIGLDNVISRLRLYYNRNDVMEITSLGENMGTEVAVFIPTEDIDVI